MRNSISIFLLVVFVSNKLAAQNISAKDLYGFWKVKDVLYFNMIDNETTYEYQDRMTIRRRCLKAKVKLDEGGIHVLPGEGQHDLLDECDSTAFYRETLWKKIVPSNNTTITDDGSEMIDSNIVGSAFVEKFDSTYRASSLSMINTNCKQGYGDYTMKICVANRNKIGLFTGADFIILVRR
jgi:hypothetical protein